MQLTDQGVNANLKLSRVHQGAGDGDCRRGVALGDR